MTEWWTYTLSDFLLFSPRTYYRLFELHHRALWPLQLAALGAGAAMLVLALRDRPPAGRAASAIAATAWLWVAWSWLLARYATINWAADAIAAAFAVQGLLLLASGVATTRLEFTAGPGARRSVGIAIVLATLFVQPLAGVPFDRPLSQAEVFGITPAATATATLGLLVLARRTRWELALLPTCACLLDGATLLAIDAPDAWVAPSIALAALLGLGLAPADNRMTAHEARG